MSNDEKNFLLKIIIVVGENFENSFYKTSKTQWNGKAGYKVI